MASLVPCTACARHVRASERTCPFCAAPIAAVEPRTLAAMPSDRLLARSAITFAAAAATTLAACGKEPADKPPAPIGTGDKVNAAPAYGVPPFMIPDGAAVEPAPPPTPPPPPTTTTDAEAEADAGVRPKK